MQLIQVVDCADVAAEASSLNLAPAAMTMSTLWTALPVLATLLVRREIVDDHHYAARR